MEDNHHEGPDPGAPEEQTGIEWTDLGVWWGEGYPHGIEGRHAGYRSRSGAWCVCGAHLSTAELEQSRPRWAVGRPLDHPRVADYVMSEGDAPDQTMDDVEAAEQLSAFVQCGVQLRELSAEEIQEAWLEVYGTPAPTLAQIRAQMEVHGTPDHQGGGAGLR